MEENNHKPIVSIVIPTYNRADFIGITLQSVVNQSNTNFEVIVVDDGSKDNTEEVVSPFLVNKNFFYYKKENGERGAARNYGATKAKGKYITFFDSDDLLYPNHVEEIEKIIKTHNNISAFHLSYDIKNKKLELLSTVTKIDENIIKGNPYSCNGVVIKKDIFDKFKFVEDRILAVSEDYELWLRLYANVGITHFPIVTSTIIQHDERSVMIANFEKLLKRRDAFFKYAFSDDTVEKKYGNKKDIFYSYWQSYISLHLIIANQKKEALKYYIESLKMNPSSFFSKRSLAIIKNLILK